MSQADAKHPLPTEAEEAKLRAWCEEREIRLKVCHPPFEWCFVRGRFKINWCPKTTKLRAEHQTIGLVNYEDLTAKLAEQFPPREQPAFDPTVPPIEDELRELAAKVPAEEWAQNNRRELARHLAAMIVCAHRVISDQRKIHRPIGDLKAMTVMAHQVLTNLEESVTEMTQETNHEYDD